MTAFTRLPGERAWIIGIDHPCRIEECRLLFGDRREYLCSYWWQGELKTVILDETELDDLEVPKK